MTRGIWLVGGVMALALGAIGIFLPLLPTVPFLLLAAFCFARSSQALHRWLIGHPTFGPPIRAWEERGAIRRRAKGVASLSMAASVGITLWLALPLWVILLQAATLTAVAVFIWTRPEA